MWELDHKEGWAQKKWCFWTLCWRRFLRVSWTARRSNQSSLKEIHWKDWCWSWSSSALANWCKELTHWNRSWCLERLRRSRRRVWQWMRWLDGITDSMDISLSKFWQIVKDRGALCAIIHGVSKNRTWVSDWTTHISQSVPRERRFL